VLQRFSNISLAPTLLSLYTRVVGVTGLYVKKNRLDPTTTGTEALQVRHLGATKRPRANGLLSQPTAKHLFGLLHLELDPDRQEMVDLSPTDERADRGRQMYVLKSTMETFAQ
jgi:hypothetical protein